MLKGKGVSPGIAVGPAFFLKRPEPCPESQGLAATGQSLSSLRQAFKKASLELEALEEKARRELGPDHASILAAQRLMLEDPALWDRIEQGVLAQGRPVSEALQVAVDEMALALESLDDPYIGERAADIRDVGARVLRILRGGQGQPGLTLDEPAIVVAWELAPSETIQLPREMVLGILTGAGGKTSHTAIIARQMGVPAVVGAGDGIREIIQGQTLVLDGDEGTVIPGADPETLWTYQERARRSKAAAEATKAWASLPSVTKDGRRIEVACNIASPQDVPGCLEVGCDGIGLFRTEFLYTGRDPSPSEEQQFEAYRQVVEALAPRPVIIRTMDVGGDKALPCLGPEKEDNPFLGFRGIRVCLGNPEAFKTQLRAILRTSPFGKIRIMFPMITALEELRQAKDLLERVQRDLILEGLEVDDSVQVGIMIEVPSAAVMARELARECDFFSIGSNDLIQYTLAADRLNERVSYLYSHYNPAVLRLIDLTVRSAHAEGIWVGICGEMAADASMVPFLIGAGIDELSVAPSALLRVKENLLSCDSTEVANIAREVLSLPTEAEVRSALMRA
ncbi:MAG: phosphoenolpyruvate--protein phosphotransferase [Bacillota bacterium]